MVNFMRSFLGGGGRISIDGINFLFFLLRDNTRVNDGTNATEARVPLPTHMFIILFRTGIPPFGGIPSALSEKPLFQLRAWISLLIVYRVNFDIRFKYI